MQQAGWIDARGSLLIDPSTLASADEQQAPGQKLALPRSVTSSQASDVLSETKAAIGEHQFNAELKVPNADFFDAHR
jgi:hypothetical protein